MVGVLTIITVCITLGVSILLPIGAGIVYALKQKGKGIWSAWLLGAAGFFIMQMVIRTPILNLLAAKPGFMELTYEHYVISGFCFAFTAALFEVIGRYVVAKLLSKNLTYERSIAAGMGHGGIEAIVIIGMAYINNLVFIIMINSNTFDSLIEQVGATGVDTASLVQVKDALLNVNPAMFLLAGYERILTMLLHVALSLLVCYFVSRKQDWKGIGICLVCHCIVDFVAPMLNGLATEYLGNKISTTTASVLVYSFLTLVAAASIVVILKIRRIWKDEKKTDRNFAA